MNPMPQDPKTGPVITIKFKKVPLFSSGLTYLEVPDLLAPGALQKGVLLAVPPPKVCRYPLSQTKSRSSAAESVCPDRHLGRAYRWLQQ